MKKPIILLSFSLSLSLTGVLLGLVGCSKSGNGPASGTATNSTAAGSASADSSASPGPTGPVDLKLKWQIGKQYDMAMDLNQSTDMNVPGQPVHQELKLAQGLNYSPLKALDNGGNQVQLKFDHQALSINQNGKDILSYDSTQTAPPDTNGPAGPVAAAMRAMLGVPLVFTFAADGTVEKIEGIDALSNSVADAVPNVRQRMSLEELYNEDTLKQYGEFSRSLPDHPVKVGDTWSEGHDINNPAGLVTVNSTYTFKNWENRNGHNCVHLLISGDVKTKSTSASTLGAVVNIKKGSINGDAWFDPNLGMFVDIKTVQDTTADIATRQMSLTQQMKQNVEISLLGVN